MIRSRLAELPLERVLIETPAARLTVGGSLSTEAGLAATCAGRTVALRVASPLVLVRALVQLDGCARRLYLASSRAPLDEVLSLAAIAGTEVAVTDACELASWTDRGVRTIDAALTTHAGSPPERDRKHDTTWLLATSGTTRQPRLVEHSAHGLTRTTRPDVPSRETRWGLLYDPARFAGLQVVLQALLSGATLLVPDAGHDLREQVEFLARAGCTHLSATPTMWRKLLMTATHGRLPLRQITLGGEIADGPILAALRARYTEARISHIYASTEAGVGFSVSDGRPGFPADLVAAPPDGVQLRVDDGELMLRAAPTQGAYAGSDERFAGADGFVRTGDLVELRGDRYHFLGRADGVINVGGDKVRPERVEAVVRAAPGVALARVGALRSAIVGALVTVDVVPTDAVTDPAEFEEALLAHCGRHLERHEMPATVNVVTDLAVNPSGKLERN